MINVFGYIVDYVHCMTSDQYVSVLIMLCFHCTSLTGYFLGPHMSSCLYYVSVRTFINVIAKL